MPTFEISHKGSRKKADGTEIDLSPQDALRIQGIVIPVIVGVERTFDTGGWRFSCSARNVTAVFSPL